MKKVFCLLFCILCSSGLSAKLLTHLEFENSLEDIIAYVLNEENEFVLSAVTKDDANETFLTISLEENHD